MSIISSGKAFSIKNTKTTKMKFIWIFAVSIFFVSCEAAQEQKNQQIRDAKSLNAASMDTVKEFLPKLKSVIEKVNSTNIQGKELTEEEKAYIDRVNRVYARYTEWVKAEARAPGFAERDQPQEYAIPADILARQKSLNKEIQEIQDQVASLYEDQDII